MKMVFREHFLSILALLTVGWTTAVAQGYTAHTALRDELQQAELRGSERPHVATPEQRST